MTVAPAGAIVSYIISNDIRVSEVRQRFKLRRPAGPIYRQRAVRCRATE
jgi:hypothetical protein